MLILKFDDGQSMPLPDRGYMEIALGECKVRQLGADMLEPGGRKVGHVRRTASDPSGWIAAQWRE